MANRLYFPDCQALVRLQYFRSGPAGSLTVRKRYAFGGFDLHTHLAWRFLFAPPADLSAHGTVQCYFPERGMPFGLGGFLRDTVPKRYASKTAWESVKSLFTGHGITRTHTVPNLLDELDSMGLSGAAVLPLDYIRQRNSRAYLAAASGQPRLVPFVSVHPFAPDRERRFLTLIRAGARGIKLHPALQLFTPDAPQAATLYEIAGAFGLPVLLHCASGGFVPAGLDRYTQPDAFRRMAAAFPRTIFVLAHGGLSRYRDVASLARAHTNVLVETSSLPPFAIRHFVRAIGADRVLFGSDWPFVPIAVSLARTLLATEGNPRARRAILRDNAARLLRLEAPVQTSVKSA